MASPPKATLRPGAGAILLALTLSCPLSAQSSKLAGADAAIQGLNQVTKDLIATVNNFHKHLDEAIADYDRGYRAPDGTRVLAADAEVNSGQADVIVTALRKFVAFRMLAARGGSFQPAAAADIDRIQKLIAESRARVDAGSPVLRRLLVVSVNDINRNDDAQVKLRHERLLRARAEAQEAAKMAFLALPIDLPDTDAPEESPQKAWDLHLAGLPISPKQGAIPAAQPRKNPAEVQPFRIERRRRFTLIRQASLRMALTDAGMEDRLGRHLFYQEEWVQRGSTVVWIRRRVAVDPATGQHILIKLYPPLEFTGTIQHHYRAGAHSLWTMEPADDATEPSGSEVESAIAAVEQSRAAVRDALRNFHDAIREAVLRDDRARDAAGEAPLDSGLSDGIRDYLFATRADLAGVKTVLQLESRIHSAIAEGSRAEAALQPLAAWANRPDAPASRYPMPVDWERLLDRADREIDSLRDADAEALAALPPHSSKVEEEFPALAKNLVVRMRGLPVRNIVTPDGRVRLLQEVWRTETGMRGSSNEVRRTVTLMIVDPQTGVQTRAAAGTKYYPLGLGGLLEEVFEEYAAQELIVGGASYDTRNPPRER